MYRELHRRGSHLRLLVLLMVFATSCTSSASAPTATEAEPAQPSVNAAPEVNSATPDAAAAPDPTPGPTPAPTSTPTPPAGPPNVVMIMMDDMRADQVDLMPITKAFFEERGTIFTNSIVSFPECCPARATAFTGQYAHNHGVLSGDLPSGGVTRFRADETLPVWLERQGYRNMLVGKYLNGYGAHSPPDVPAGWHDWFGLIDPTTLFWWQFEAFDNGQVATHGTAPEEHRTTVLGQRALADIDQAVELGDPFLLWFAPVAPHIGFRDAAAAAGGTGVAGVNGLPSGLTDGAGWFPPPAFDDVHADLVWSPPLTFAALDRSGKHPQIANATEMSASQAIDVEEDFREIAETLAGVDAAIGALIDRLEAQNVLDHTVIIFTSDNGYFFGEHRLVYLKYWPYEEALRVPLMISGPGFGPAVVNAPVSNIDLAPTIAAIAGAEPAIAVDGLDLAVVAADPDRYAGRALLIESGPTFGRPVYSGVRTHGLKYIEYRDGHREFYDLIADPWEQTSLAGADAPTPREAALARTLGALRACAGSTCTMLDEGPAAPRAIIDATVDPIPGATFTLSAGGSFDPDGGPLTFVWSQIGGAPTALLGRNRPNVALLAPPDGETVTMVLTVTDDEGDSAAAQIVVTAADRP